jgi:ABC-type branched-subunit amino acid transport system substrate-binding protein
MSGSRGVALLLSSLLALSACQGGAEPSEAFPVRTPVPSPSSAEGPVIGLVGTMMGPGSWRGRDAFEGADLAVHVLNKARRGNELPFELVSLDDEGDPGRATELVEELATSERTAGIVYAGPTEGLPPANDLLAETGNPAVLVYGDLYSARLLRSHLFQASPPMLWQARRMASYLLKDRGYRKIGVLAQRSLDGNTAVDSIKAALAAQTKRAPVVRRYKDAAGFEGALVELQLANVEAIVTQGPPDLFLELVELLEGASHSYESTAAARTVSAPRRDRLRSLRGKRPWRPQLVAFDEAIRPQSAIDLPAGTIASDSYARGAHYLPVPSFERFRTAFQDWWDSEPLGWQRRSFEATQMIGWAARHTGPGEDRAKALETLSEIRFGGLDVRFGPDDHTSVEQTTIGLWTIPSRSAAVRERARLPENLSWVPLARGFSTNGRRTELEPQDWRWLFRDPPPIDGPGPLLKQTLFGVVSGKKDPIH